MKIAVLQGSSQKDKNQILMESVNKAVKSEDEVINFGIFEDETINFSYIQTALCISMLLESGAVDFAVTGCSSGQGMMLACNSLPGVECGYIANPSDAYLFGRINKGNAISYPLGLNWGWAAEINLQDTLKRLFSEPFGCGYPKKDAERKMRDTKLLKELSGLTKKTLIEIIPLIDEGLFKSVLKRQCVVEYIMKYGSNKRLMSLIAAYPIS